MPNTRVSVEIRMTRSEFFCDIIFTVIDNASLEKMAGVWIDLKTLAGELITKVWTNADGMATILSMPVGETYAWYASCPDYDPVSGTVTTI